MAQSPELVKKRLLEAYKWQCRVADRIRPAGFELRIPPLRIAQTPEQIAEFSDEGDLFVVRKNGTEIRLETKAINYKWTSIDDHPFRNHITVERVATWEAKAARDELPEAIILLSQETGVSSAFVILAATKRYWWKEDTEDKAAEWTQPYFYTTHECVMDWDGFIFWLRGRVRI